MRVPDRPIQVLLAILVLVVGFSALTTPASADRPGTPNNFTIFNCFHSPAEKPYVCGSFTNTAHEDVVFEMEWVRNGSPVGIRPGPCIEDNQTNFGCYEWGKSYKWGETYVDLTKRSIPLRFTAKELEFDTTYCARLRARRTSDDMVSEIWATAPCVKTPGPPAAPSPPQFSIIFDGRQPSSSGPSIAAILRVAYTKLDGAGLAKIKIYEAVGADNRGSVLDDSQEFKAWSAVDRKVAHEYKIDPKHPWLYVEVCSVNISGQTCSHQVASATAESVVQGPVQGEKPVKVTGRAGDLTFQQDINLPGMDYRKQALNGNDPLQCQQSCNADPACKAWTFVKGGVQSANAMCWLKNDIPRPAYDKNTVSGVKPQEKSAEPPGPPILYKTELPGNEYRQVAQSTSLWWECRGLCSRESQCMAWTWYPPTVKGPTAICSLKNAVPASVANDKAASGVKDGAGPGAPPPVAQPNSAPQTPVVAAPVQPPAPTNAASSVQRTGSEAPASSAQPLGKEGGNAAAERRAAVEAAAQRAAAQPGGIQTGVDMPGQDYRNAALNEGTNEPVVCRSLCAQDPQCKAWTWVKAGVQGPKVMCWLKNEIPHSVPNPNTVSGLSPAHGSHR